MTKKKSTTKPQNISTIFDLDIDIKFISTNYDIFNSIGKVTKKMVYLLFFQQKMVL